MRDERITEKKRYSHKPQADLLVQKCEGNPAGTSSECVCLPTFPVRHLYSPGAVKRIGVKIWKARREDGPRLSVNVASTKGCREDERDTEK